MQIPYRGLEWPLFFEIELYKWLSNHKLYLQLKFKEDWAIGHLEENPGNSRTVDVQCFPFYSILLALNIKHIDVFSLDVEGAEVLILDTIPFDKVDISMLNVEYQHVKGGRIFCKVTYRKKAMWQLKKFSEILLWRKN